MNSVFRVEFQCVFLCEMPDAPAGKHKSGRSLRCGFLTVCQHAQMYNVCRAVKKFSEMWYSTGMVGHVTTLT